MHKLNTIVKKFIYSTVLLMYRIKVMLFSIFRVNCNTSILVTGFQHSGTSILRKIIGNHAEVLDVPEEIDFREIVEPNTSGNTRVIKTPNCDDKVFKACRIPKNIKIVCIIRDPRDVFVSVRKRRGQSYSLEKFKEEWSICVRNVLEIAKQQNGRLVRYEDLFKNNFEEVRQLFHWLELPYDESVITKNTKRRVPIAADAVPEEEPSRVDHARFRSYQINQEVKQMSGQYLTELSESEKRFFIEDSDIKELMALLRYT